jgi:AcrR family transcriptional regulator
MSKAKSTDKKIIDAFSELVLEQGYTGATTKKIAEVAGINESTLFRHFKDKKNLVEFIAEQYYEDIKKVGAKFELSGDLTQDLTEASRLYTYFIDQHKVLFVLSLRESYAFPELSKLIGRLPNEFYDILIENFTKMIESNEMDPAVNVKAEAYNFVVLNFGNTVMNLLYDETFFTEKPEKFAENVAVFAEHLKKK